MNTNQNTTQAESYHERMVRLFPTLYRLPTPAELNEALAIVARPIAGMQFAIGDEVSHYLTRRKGTVESCTKYDDGRLKYVVAWHDGQRNWQWESDIRAVEGREDRQRYEQIDALRAIINELDNRLTLRPKYSGIYSRAEREAMGRELAEAKRELIQLEAIGNG